jgi:hypothetical protein
MRVFEDRQAGLPQPGTPVSSNPTPTIQGDVDTSPGDSGSALM